MKSWLLPRRWLTCDCLCARSRARHRYPCVSECWSAPAWGEWSTVTCLSLPPCHSPYNSRERALQTILERDMRSKYHIQSPGIDLFVTISDGLDQSSKFAQRWDFLLRPVMTRPVLCSVHRPGLVWVDPGPRSKECAMVASPLSSHHAAACRTGETIASKATRPVMQMMEILAAF